jgi:hypothetical protein
VGYVLECYSADVDEVRAAVGAGEDLGTVLYTTGVLIGSLQHASGSGVDLRSAIVVALGELATDQLLDRPELLGTPDLGGYPSVGGFTTPELDQATRRLDALLATDRAVPPGDAGDWLYELRAILREALSEGRDLITVYH